MSRRYRSDSAHGDRPTLPPIRDLFGDQLSRTPIPAHVDTNSPPHSFSRSSFSDDEGYRPTVDGQHSSQIRINTGRPEPTPSQRSLPGTPHSIPTSIRPRSSSTLPPLMYAEMNRELRSHPTSSHGHYPSMYINEPSLRGGLPSGAAYHSPLSHRAPSDPLGSPSHDQAVLNRPYSRGGSPYDSRSSRHSDADQGSLRGSPSEYQAASSVSALSRLERPVEGSSTQFPIVAKYECNYCGKGFNRPSSLKIHLNSHTGDKPFTCSFEGCGRSFSVLSNMRRHARVHTSVSQLAEGSSDEESDERDPMPVSVNAIPLPGLSTLPASVVPSMSSGRPINSIPDLGSHNRSSSASSDDSRPEKRSRH